MPVFKKKRITPESALSMSEPSCPELPEQQEFPQHLRALAQSAMRTVLELVMREELDAFIGAAWGECSPKRNGYRNGTYTRDLVTSTGRLEEIKVPRDRAGHFHTQAFGHYSRYEPHIADGLMQMFVAGTSTHKVGEVAQTLMGVALSASTISRLNQSLSHQFEDLAPASSARALACLVSGWCTLQHPSWRQGRFNDHFDGLRSGSGRKQRGLGARACAEESKEGWVSVLPRPTSTRRDPNRPHRD